MKRGSNSIEYERLRHSSLLEPGFWAGLWSILICSEFRKVETLNTPIVRLLLGLGLVVALVVGGYRLIWPSYSWNQKLTIVVDTPQGEVTGSSIVRVTWSDSPDFLIDASHWYYKVRGEATVVDLGEGKYLFYMISTAERLALAAFSSSRLPQNPDGLAPFIRAVAAQRNGTTRPLSLGKSRNFVMFDDISDPKTIRQVNPENLAAIMGPGYALKSATLEISRELVTTGEVDKVLGWLNTVGLGMLDGASGSDSGAPNPLANRLTTADFIRR